VHEFPDGGKCTFCPVCQRYTHQIKLPVDSWDREEFLTGLIV
jgi:hypothetical protein